MACPARHPAPTAPAFPAAANDRHNGTATPPATCRSPDRTRRPPTATAGKPHRRAPRRTRAANPSPPHGMSLRPWARAPLPDDPRRTREKPGTRQHTADSPPLQGRGRGWGLPASITPGQAPRPRRKANGPLPHPATGSQSSTGRTHGPPRHFDDHATPTRRDDRRRRNSPPVTPNPAIIISQLAGSGTTVTASSMRRLSRPKLVPDRE